MKIRALAAVLAAGAVALAGCGGGSSSSAGSAATASGAPRTLTVLAAASLTESFNALGKKFEAANPGVTVRFSYGGSSQLAAQIVQGSPADVFAAASDATMKTVTDKSLTTATPTKFATNVLEIATPPGNPKQIASFADLAKPGVKVVVCAPAVPCGAAEQKIEQATGTKLSPVSKETDVKAVYTKVATGNADAGLVYVTDVKAAGDKVQGVSFPEASKAVTNYPIAVIKSSQQADLAQQFLTYVTGADGQQALKEAGFGSP